MIELEPSKYEHTCPRIECGEFAFHQAPQARFWRTYSVSKAYKLMFAISEDGLCIVKEISESREYLERKELLKIGLGA